MSKKFKCRVEKSEWFDEAEFNEFGSVSHTKNGHQWYKWDLAEEDLVLLYNAIGEFLIHAGERTYVGENEKLTVEK